jgi:chromosome segregation ATPase
VPQIEQVQVVHWGSLRPDPIELDPGGINVATGANGSGKTCLLDAAKLILGVDQLKQKPNEYIFDGRGNPARRSDRAYVKAIFRNPERPGRAGRIFADAGRGCELTDQVTAICEIMADRRRYTILAGAITWGTGGRRLEDDLRGLEKLGHAHWLGPRQWSDLLARAGVSRALLGVISVKQGETDRAIDGSPEDLLRRMLELTGKQQTLDEFRQARTKLARAREEYHIANERFLSEHRELERLKAQAARHEEFLRTEARRKAIEDLELPTARRRARERELDDLRREREQRQGQLQQSIEEIESLALELPALEGRLDELELAAKRLIKETDEARLELEHRSGEERAAVIAVEQAEAELGAARLIVDPLDMVGLARLEHASAEAGQLLLNTESEKERLAADIFELEAGRPPRPDGLDSFRALLSGRGIETLLLADGLELDEGHAVAGEAVLDRGVWTLVIPGDRYEEAVRLARERGYRLPLARAGDGKPAGIFASSSGAPAALAYLAEIDMPLTEDGDPGVATDGLVRGHNWATFRAARQAALGEHARKDALKIARARTEGLERELPHLRQNAKRARQEASAVVAGLAAKERIVTLARSLERARGELEVQRKRASDASHELAESGPELGKVREEVKAKRVARSGAEARRSDLAPRVLSLRAEVEARERDLENQPLTASQAGLGELPTIDALQHELAQVVMVRLEEFKDEERSSLAPIQRDDQAAAVAEAEEYLAGRDDVVRQAEVELERARKSYDEHIRQTMQALNRSFREVCEQAGMEGEVRLVPSAAVEGEWALDVRVAHNPDEPKKPYQSREHSGGQRAKISILLLLAAMSIEGAADLLIMDEHIAHLDSQNIDYVAEVMSALKGKVQFLLATPTNAEAGRLTWCDHQLAFLPRQKGDPYSPPIRLFTRLPAEDQPPEVEPAAQTVGTVAR